MSVDQASWCFWFVFRRYLVHLDQDMDYRDLGLSWASFHILSNWLVTIIKLFDAIWSELLTPSLNKPQTHDISVKFMNPLYKDDTE
jgi:hypothetical protein